MHATLTSGMGLAVKTAFNYGSLKSFALANLMTKYTISFFPYYLRAEVGIG